MEEWERNPPIDALDALFMAHDYNVGQGDENAADWHFVRTLSKVYDRLSWTELAYAVPAHAGFTLKALLNL